ncbi:treacle protein [Petaurus breviceps papuanus]|uniref:treacle protein n=1 Tax=Petaurus breviceps papuanus TaxID=3040969 RepID=UPI0036DD967F
MTEARKRRELLPLIHHHLVQAGYVRAAREVKLQSGQKTFPAQSVTLLDIYTHWQQTSEVAKKRKAEEADGEIPYKVRVSDPTSSSESSEEEKEKEGVGTTVKSTRVLYSNSVSLTKDTQCKNSLSKPKEKVKTKNKKGTSKTLVTSASHPDPLEAQTTSEKPGPTVSVQSPSKKSPAAPRKQAAPPPSSSLATHGEEKVASPVVKPVPKPAPMPPDKKTESSSEDSSSDETDIEMGTSALVRSDSAASVPTKGSQEKVVTPSPGTLVTKPRTAKDKSPEETSESSDESEDAPSPQRQTQEVKTPGRVSMTTAAKGKTITPSSKPNLGLPSKAAKTQKAEESSETSEESESEEEDALLQRPQVRPGGRIRLNQGVIKTPLIFVDPSRSPTGKAAVPMKARTASRKRQVLESREQNSSESEDDGIIPDTQHPTLPTIKAVLVGVAPTCPKASYPLGTVQPEASMEESSSESASKDQGTGTSQTTCIKSETAKQDKKSKLVGGTQAKAAQDSFSGTTSNGAKNEKEDSEKVKAKQTQNLGLSPKGSASMNTECPEDSSEEEIIEPSQSILSAYTFPSSSLPVSINPQLQKASPKQRLAAVASAGPALSAYSKGSSQSDSSDSEAECKTESKEQPPPTEKELKTSVPSCQAIGKEFKPGMVNCIPTSSKHGIVCQSPIKSSNLPSLIRLQILSTNENSESNNASLNSKAPGIRMLSNLPQLEKKKKSTETPKSGKGSKKSKSKRKLAEDSPVAKAPESKKKKLMREVHKEREALQEKTTGTPKVGRKEKASGDAKGKKPKGVPSSKKNKEKPERNITITVGESGEMMGAKTKKEKKQKKKSDKKKKDKDKKDKKKKFISKNPDPASASLKKEKKKKKKVKQVD